jgi:hypothetical protein
MVSFDGYKQADTKSDITLLTSFPQYSADAKAEKVGSAKALDDDMVVAAGSVSAKATKIMKVKSAKMSASSAKAEKAADAKAEKAGSVSAKVAKSSAKTFKASSKAEKSLSL